MTTPENPGAPRPKTAQGKAPASKAPPVGRAVKSPPPGAPAPKAPPVGTVSQKGPKTAVPSPKSPPAPPQRPVARPARLQRRHMGLMLGFGGVVIAPLLVTVLYLWIFAVDQYASVTGFTVRQEEGGGASEILGGLAAITGSSASSDSDILYAFIRSQDMVRGVDGVLDLVDHFSSAFPRDPVFALWPRATIEDLQDLWQRKVQITLDQSTGLIEVRALAFDPVMANAINEEIVVRSQDMINNLNLQSREDAMGYATDDLDEALARLKAAREALTAWRTRTQIVDPEADMQGRMGVMGNLQQQLAQALIDYDLLQQTTSEGDPRLRQSEQRIAVIRGRIADERKSFATDAGGAGPDGEDYPTLIAEYEGLLVDREFAEETYRAALAAVDLARAKAQRQSRYLATYIPPTLAEIPEHPRRFVLSAITAGFLILLWSIMALVYYSIRDRG